MRVPAKPARRKAVAKRRKTELDHAVEIVFKALHGREIKPEGPESIFPL